MKKNMLALIGLTAYSLTAAEPQIAITTANQASAVTDLKGNDIILAGPKSLIGDKEKGVEYTALIPVVDNGKWLDHVALAYTVNTDAGGAIYVTNVGLKDATIKVPKLEFKPGQGILMTLTREGTTHEVTLLEQELRKQILAKHTDLKATFDIRCHGQPDSPTKTTSTQTPKLTTGS